jgi:lipoate-protein ligase A
MICIRSTSYDPCFNLAAEEYLLKKTSLDFFILYTNVPSVIVGKHQNTLAEINFDFIRKNNIKVVRRITGGGTVYHDEGNLNYSFIRNGEKGKLVDFKRYTRPVTDFLLILGLHAEDDGRNSLTINGRKISGNAEHVHQDRVLHHGTLLFSSDLENLEGALKPGHSSYQDKAIRSVKSRVANLTDFTGITNMALDTFKDGLFNFVKRYFMDSTEYEFTAGDLEEISRLVKDKYKTWQWNFGYSPKYSLRNEIRFQGNSYVLTIETEHGLITRIGLEGETGAGDLQERLGEALASVPHSWEEVYKGLRIVLPDTGDRELESLISGFF